MTIRTLIVEDEKPAAEHLLNLLSESRYKLQVLHVCDSVSQSVAWLRTNPAPDLILLDIQLADGLSFEIFNHLEIRCPVIFTTAFEEYAIRAFKMNSIDYLLKPVARQELDFALNKYLEHELQTSSSGLLNDQVERLMQLLVHPYKSRFVINIGPRIKTIETLRIRYFYSMEKSTFLFDDSGVSYGIGISLDQLQKQLDPGEFFRISRRYIININAIADIYAYSSSRLKLHIKGSGDEHIFVSRRNIHAFREWLDK